LRKRWGKSIGFSCWFSRGLQERQRTFDRSLDGAFDRALDRTRYGSFDRLLRCTFGKAFGRAVDGAFEDTFHRKRLFHDFRRFEWFRRRRQSKTDEVDIRSLVEQHVSSAGLVFSKVSDKISFSDGFHVFVVAEHPVSLCLDGSDIVSLMCRAVKVLLASMSSRGCYQDGSPSYVH
jgi:hypothetical protein